MSNSYKSLDYHESCVEYAQQYLKNHFVELLSHSPQECECCQYPTSIAKAYFMSNYDKAVIPYNQCSLEKYTEAINYHPDTAKLKLIAHLMDFFEKDKKIVDIVNYSSWIINFDREMFQTTKKSEAKQKMIGKIRNEMLLIMLNNHAIKWKIKFIDSNRYVVPDDLDLSPDDIACHISLTNQVELTTPKEAIFVKNALNFGYQSIGIKSPKTEIEAFDINSKKVDWYLITDKIPQSIIMDNFI